MTAEKLHDALSLLPSDLITATDKVRTQPRATVIHWRRWVSIAACAVLVLGVSFVFVNVFLPKGGSMEAAMEYESAAMDCAPEAPAAMAPPTEAPAADSANSTTSGSRQEAEPEEALTPTGYPTDGAFFIDLNAVQRILTYPIQDGNLCIDSSQTTMIRTTTNLETYLRDWGEYYDLYSLEEACAAFDEGWFESFDLLLIRADTEMSELVPSIDSVTFWQDRCEIVICSNLMPEDNSLDPACWHILLPVEKGLLPDGTIIDIVLE